MNFHKCPSGGIINLDQLCGIRPSNGRTSGSLLFFEHWHAAGDDDINSIVSAIESRQGTLDINRTPPPEIPTK